MITSIEAGKPIGAIPPERLKPILTNARTKEADRLAKEVYGFTPSDFQRLGLRDAIDLLDKNPVAFVRALSNRLVAQGLMAAPSAPAPPATVAPPPTKPAPDLRTEDGTLVYSSPQMEKLLAWQMGQFKREIADQLQPVDDWKRHAEHERIQATAKATAQQQFDEARTWEGFTEHQAEIFEEAKRMMAKDGRFTLEGAYNRVLQKIHMPGLKAKMRADLLKEIQTARPNATTTAPSAVPRGASGRKTRGMDWDAAVNRALDTVTRS